MRPARVRAPWQILATHARARGSEGERAAGGRGASLPPDVSSGLAEAVIMVTRLPVSTRELVTRTRGQRDDLAEQTRARTVTRHVICRVN